jgi:ATP-dependent RNA/DNA helicase IGHMBP2
MMRIKPSDHLRALNPWLGLVLTINDSTGVVTCLLLHSPRESFPEEPVAITIQRFHSSSELSKSILVRAHAYFKCVGSQIAAIEAKGIKRSEHAALPHSIHIPSLIFQDLALPAKREIPTPGFKIDMFPQTKCPLNTAQKQALDHCALTAGRIVLINGPPGTGKSLFLSKIIALGMLTSKCVLVTAAINAVLDVLLRKTLSTFGTEKPVGFTGQPRILRIVAPLRAQVELLVSTATDSTQQADDFTKQFDLSHQRVKLASSLNTEDSRKFLQLHEAYQRNGFLPDNNDAREYVRIANHFDNKLIHATTICFTTTSMASHKGVISEFLADWVITDESANCRLDQLFNSIMWQPKISLWMLAGDPIQHPLFVTNRVNNPLGESLHAQLVDRGFAGVVQLVEQHRMEPNLIKFVNERFYNGMLTTAEAVKAGRPQFHHFMQIIDKKPTLPNGTVITGNNMYFDVSNGFGEEDSHSSTKNQAEAKFAVELTSTLIAAGVSAKSILIISPYSSQVKLILHKLAIANLPLKDLAVHTIDSTQGDERDIVILSLACGGRGAKVGFIVDDSRVVVALTRQKLARYVIANKRFFTQSPRDHGMRDFTLEMDRDGLVRQIIVCDVPAPPARASRYNDGEPRTQRKRGPRGENRFNRKPKRKLDPVKAPTEVPASQLLAIQYFAEHDANAY